VISILLAESTAVFTYDANLTALIKKIEKAVNVSNE